MSAIRPDLLAAIAERARDPSRRTSLAESAANATPIDPTQLTHDMREHGGQGALPLVNMATKLEGMLGKLEGVIAMGPGGPLAFGEPPQTGDLPAPASDTAIAEAERAIGRALPEALKDLYRIADGGFGPGPGLLSLGEAVNDYRARTKEPFGPLGQHWPAALLVICDPDDTPTCIDIATGALIIWEAERIEDEESEADWQASFVPLASDLAHWIESWLGEETFADLNARLTREEEVRQAARGVSPVTGFPIQFDDIGEQVEGEIAFLRASDDLRILFDLPRTGWEDEVRRRYGLSGS